MRIAASGMSSVGTWAWAERTNGRLRRRDRAELLRQGVLARLSALPARFTRRLSDGPAPEIPTPPDSALALLADERVRELSAPELYGHCLRTWAFAAMFAVGENVEHDPELLYLACVLHDLGLTSAHDGADASAGCFAVEGARAAHRLICDHGDSQVRARTVAEAITLHLNVTVPSSLGAEAMLLSKGVSLDTVGRRLHQLPAPSLRAVATRWPRDGSTEYLVASTERQATVRPGSRSAFLHRLGFAGLLRANPLDA
jgi:HD domain-containing protein